MTTLAWSRARYLRGRKPMAVEPDIRTPDPQTRTRRPLFWFIAAVVAILVVAAIVIALVSGSGGGGGGGGY
jgi:ABC-type Fe3+ transport system permease subunit